MSFLSEYQFFNMFLKIFETFIVLNLFPYFSAFIHLFQFFQHRRMVRHAPWTTLPFGCVRCSRRNHVKSQRFERRWCFFLSWTMRGTIRFCCGPLLRMVRPARRCSQYYNGAFVRPWISTRCWGNIPMVDLRHSKWWHCPVDLLDAAHWEVDWSTAFCSLFHPRQQDSLDQDTCRTKAGLRGTTIHGRMIKELEIEDSFS